MTKPDLHDFTTQEPTQPKARFDEEVLADLRRRVPEYLGKIGVELRERGGRLVGRCPMHDDSSPSFAVYGARHENCGCYPCGFSDDVFAVSQWLGRASSFPEAVAEVAATLGLYLPQDAAGRPTRAATATPRPERKPEVPFILSNADREKIHAARLAWCDAFDNGEPIVGRIAESLGLNRETLRHAAWGESGLGLAPGGRRESPWLSYAYPNGLKWRNPDPQGKPRFRWLVGKATAPWRMEWALKPEVRTIYLTEGETDCLALIECGLEADGTAACVASPGTSFRQAWAAMFTGKRVVLCFDSDPAGVVAAGKVAAMLKGHAASVLNWKGGRP
jgi:hypothetical protein